MNNLDLSLIGGFLITTGIMFSELALEKHSYALIGGTLLLMGWVLFLGSQRYELALKGLAIPAIAIAGQFYIAHILSEPVEYRRSMIGITFAFMLTFISTWIYYAYNMNGRYTWSGLTLFILGIMGYFVIRKGDASDITGGIIPKFNLGFGIFNPFVPMVGYGWALMAM